MSRTEYGIQMYSLRDITDKDLQGALKLVAEQGYKYVEFAGFFGHPAEEVKSWLDEYGLICSGTHTNIKELAPDRMEDTVRYHKIIGCNNLIVPGACWSTKEDLLANVDTFNRAQPILEEAGIALGYHNHSHEFLPTDYGMMIHEELEKRCPKLEFEIDTFWAFNAGLDPVALLERLKDRIRVIHLKDGIPCKDRTKPHDGVVGKSVGSGEAPVLAVREKALELGLLMVIESEGLNPTGPEEVGRCISFLRSLEK